MELARTLATPDDMLSATFFALADPTRRAILARLASGEASVTELAEPFAMSQPAVSKHLRILERAGLVATEAQAQRRPRRLVARPLGEATAYLERYRAHWEHNFARLDAVLAEMQSLSHVATPRTPRTRRARRSPRRSR